MSSTDTEDLPGSLAPVLSAALLARVHELNLDYLELLIAESAAAEGQVRHLPVRVAAAVLALSAQARRLVANLPFTLYSLAFEDPAFWHAACEPVSLQSATGVAERYAVPATASSQQAFCEIALLHAWHVASSNRLAARVVYAMPETTALRLTAIPLWRLKRIAAEHPGLLLPRWPTNPAFWPDLVRFAVEQDPARLQTAQLVGCQLIAAELELACPGQRAVRACASPRLRARRWLGRR